jgi:hypothetical protein
MTDHRARYGPHNPAETYVAHEFSEQLVDLGEVEMNYATAGDAASPALLLIAGQTESSSQRSLPEVRATGPPLRGGRLSRRCGSCRCPMRRRSWH